MGTINDDDALLLKCDKMGNVIWNCTWGGIKIDRGYGIVIDSLNNVYIAGYTESFGLGWSDIFIVKYNNSGSQLWELTWGTTELEEFSDITIDTMDNIYIVGMSNGNSVLVKFDSSGNVLWNTIIDYGSNTHGVVMDSKNNIFCVSENVVRKYNSTNDLKWIRLLSGPEFLSDITVDNNDNLYILEERNIKYPPDNLYFGGYIECICTAIYLEKYDSSGNFLWEIRCTGCSSSGGNCISLDSLNNIYICGTLSLDSNRNNVQDILLIKNPENRSGKCTEIYFDLIALSVVNGVIMAAIIVLIIRKRRSKTLENIRTNL